MSLSARALDQQAAPEAPPPALDRIHSLLTLVASAAGIAVALWLLGDILLVLFASVLLAVILHGVASLLTRHARLPYWASLLVVVLTVLVLLGGLVALAGPGLVEQAVQLRQALGRQAGTVHDRLAQSGWGRTVLHQMPSWMGGEKKSGGDARLPAGLAQSVAGIVGSVFGAFGTLAVVAVAAVYLAASPDTYRRGALRLCPVAHRAQADRLMQVAGHALWSWSAGQALDMLVVGVVSGLGLWIIGVPLALVLGVVAGLFNFVPYIGAIVGAIPAVIIGFSTGASHGVETVVLYLVVQGLEGNVMAPMIQKRAVNLPPGLTILSQTVFGTVLGAAGLIFATPITAALLAMLDDATPKLDADAADGHG